MIRKIIEIDESKCNGCGLCVKACHEGAIGIIDNKAKLLRDDYCDGLGDCLPVCPKDAIKFVEREAKPFDEKAVLKNKENNINNSCKGKKITTFKRENNEDNFPKFLQSKLEQWPVQIKLVPVNAHYFDGADLLISADCTAYAYANFHRDFMASKITLIGCPKLDDTDYTKKLTDIIISNNIKSLTVAKMEVPCCTNIERVVVNALKNSGKSIPLKVFTISTDGNILNKDN